MSAITNILCLFYSLPATPPLPPFPHENIQKHLGVKAGVECGGAGRADGDVGVPRAVDPQRGRAVTCYKLNFQRGMQPIAA
jgi:hypothetical protein